MSTAAEWVRTETSEAPDALRDAMLAALANASGPVAATLADAALSVFADLVASSGDRRDALPLLAADALLTHAFAAEADQGDVTGLADQVLVGLGTLADGVATR